MSGHVFHPGHEELHGITVVVDDHAGRTFVGRYHEQGPRGLVLHDVAVHDPAANPMPRDEWLGRQRRFGVQVAHRLIVVPVAETQSVQRLSEL
jgi:hypothetical protein